MADDEDWFEEALREEDGGDDRTDEGTGETAASDGDADDATTAANGEPENREPGGGEPTNGEQSDDATGEDATGGDQTDGDQTDGDLFEEDFSAALDQAGDPPEPGGQAADAGDQSGGEFGMGGDDDFGAGGGGEFGMGGDDDFGMGGGGEFGMGGGDDFGMGGGGFGMGGGQSDFDDEDFESDIPRISLGIEGLDEMIRGGVPERSMIVAMGGAGTGKTTFALQFLHEALENGERGVFITLEETQERILSTTAEKGWDWEEYHESGDLAVIDLDPVEMANSLTSIRSELPLLVEEFGASRLVLDSVSLLEMMYDSQAKRRTEIYDFTRSLKEAGVTTMFTSEASDDNSFASRHGIIEYLTDAVFVLRYVRPDDFRETRLAIEIQKIRDANHSRETKPYEITDTGISVYRQANIF